MDGGGVVATLVAHDERSLAGEGGVFHLAVDAFGDMPRQRGLAGAGIAEQAEHRRRAVLAGLCLEPVGHGFQRRILMRREAGHTVTWREGARRKGATHHLNLTIQSAGASCAGEMPATPSR